MNTISKNTIKIFIILCVFFIAFGIFGASLTIYDMVKNKKNDTVLSGIILTISSAFIFFPLVIMLIMLVIYIIKMYDKYKYGYQPVLYTEIDPTETVRI